MTVSKRILLLLLGMIAVASLTACTSSGKEDPLARGKYMVMIGGCNDCHTPGYGENEGNIPEEKWLTGDILGFRGPWGTTYPRNLRTFLPTMTEDEWVTFAKSFKARPPMPYFNVNAMTEDDLRAIHKYVLSLGATGQESPDYVPPDQEPPPPFIQWP